MVVVFGFRWGHTPRTTSFHQIRQRRRAEMKWKKTRRLPERQFSPEGFLPLMSLLTLCMAEVFRAHS